ncbi:hypothetical protein FIBSPDRAFT_1050204 [Athelia psychrophila]|uniref:DUF6533 domain-containing protein n=1 Tax=Athelia psychrophila TaxID=1759441 RepID=A0A166B0X6_9AGAM|nr:hypothetical protein FIBSPDRAFT_1050204 [Fibularhizoctonia sp. CBS 109695]
MTAAGMVVLLYDHLLTFDREWRLIWKTKWDLTSCLFVFNRYIVLGAMIMKVHDISGLGHPVMSNKVCQWSIGVAMVLGIVSIATSNFLVMLRVWALLDERRSLIMVTGLAFVVTQVAALITTGVILPSMLPDVFYDEPITYACLISRNPGIPLGFIWLPGLFFEVSTFIIVVWNALDRPRSGGSPITKSMYRDGFVYFTVLFVLRLLNLTLGFAAPASLLFLGMLFIWCFTNVTLSRLILNSRQAIADHAAADARGLDTPAPYELASPTRVGSGQSMDSILKHSADYEMKTRQSQYCTTLPNYTTQWNLSP